LDIKTIDLGLKSDNGKDHKETRKRREIAKIDPEVTDLPNFPIFS
jgi:hypothetical protein